MTSRALLGVTILVAISAATAEYCHQVAAGFAEGIEQDFTDTAPANTNDYSIPISQVCPDHLQGVIAQACSEYDFVLSIPDSTQVDVHRDVSPDALVVSLKLFCKSDNAKVVAVKQNVHNSPRNKSSEENATSENATGENATSENVHKSSRRKRSAKKQKVEEDENQTSEKATLEDATIENQTSEKEKSKKSSKVKKDEKKQKKLEKKNKRSSKQDSTQEADVNATFENDDKQNEGKVKVKSSKSKKVSKDGKIKKVSYKSGPGENQESKKVKVVKQKADKGVRSRRSAEKVNVEFASSSSSEQVRE